MPLWGRCRAYPAARPVLGPSPTPKQGKQLSRQVNGSWPAGKFGLLLGHCPSEPLPSFMVRGSPAGSSSRGKTNGKHSTTSQFTPLARVDLRHSCAPLAMCLTSSYVTCQGCAEEAAAAPLFRCCLCCPQPPLLESGQPLLVLELSRLSQLSCTLLCPPLRDGGQERGGDVYQPRAEVTAQTHASERALPQPRCAHCGSWCLAAEQALDA